MNRSDLDARNAAAIRRHARSLADNDMRATRPLLDDLARIADEHATTLRDDYGHRDSDSMGAPSPVAADTEVTAGVPPTMPPAGPPPRPRTRTRTRGGPR